jgi:2,4-diketo-3-deoxy-L-fuconate hydrolase
MTLLPGDVIATGTPEGVGSGQTPPVYLRPGDWVEYGASGLGSARQHVVAWERPA